MSDTSTIWFVGAGPGDPELITVRGMRLLEGADVVVYAGSLVNVSVVQKYCRDGIELYNSATMTLEEITGIMVEAARRGRRVVRLHTGDTALYSAIGEQIEALEAERVPTAVVPGVTSAFAAAASLKRELTLPGGTQTVILTRRAGRTPVPESESISRLASHNSTICLFLSVGMMDEVVAELIEGGYREDTPVAVVYRASWEDERIIIGILSDIAARVEKAEIERQAMIIVGDAVAGALPERSKLYDPDFSHGHRG